MARLVFGVCAVLFAVCAMADAQEPPATQTQARRGHFTTTFAEASPHSPIEAQARRHHIKVEDRQRYKLADESFEIYVPESYDGEKPFGLLVWISPTASGKPPQEWLEALDQRRLIWAGANNSGNERGVGVRFGLALDAAHNLSRQYHLDDARVYVAGFSGGGKCASMLGIIYPEIFRGAISMGGVGFYRAIPIPDKKNMVWPNTFDRPPTKTFDLARTRGRFVLLTGSEDFNHDPVKATHEAGFVKDGFAFATYVEVPGLAHTLPDASWFDDAIEALDHPLIDMARHTFAEAEELGEAGRFIEAQKLYTQVSMHGTEELGEKADTRIAAMFERAGVEVRKARQALEAGRFAEAASILTAARQAFGPSMPPEAGELLASLQSNPDAKAQIEAAAKQEQSEQRETAAAAALDSARTLLGRDLKRGYDALRKLASDYAGTRAATDATAEADRLLNDPATGAKVKVDPNEVEAQKMLNLAENYRRNRLWARARERLTTLIAQYPQTKAAGEARRMLKEIEKEERR